MTFIDFSCFSIRSLILLHSVAQQRLTVINAVLSKSAPETKNYIFSYKTCSFTGHESYMIPLLSFDYYL